MESKEWIDDYGYLLFPLSIVDLADQLIKIVDDYRKKIINNREIEEIINFYAKTQSKKMFSGDRFNITIQRKIGKQRIELIEFFLTKDMYGSKQR